MCSFVLIISLTKSFEQLLQRTQVGDPRFRDFLFPHLIFSSSFFLSLEINDIAVHSSSRFFDLSYCISWARA